MSRDLYVLEHTHEYNSSFYVFYYHSTNEFPYPDLDALIDELHVDFEPARGEVLEMSLVTEVREFTADQIGGKELEAIRCEGCGKQEGDDGEN